MKLIRCTFESLLSSRGVKTHFSPKLVRQCHIRYNSTQEYPRTDINIPPPKLDWSYLTDPANYDKISKNIALRNSSADFNQVLELHKEYSTGGSTDEDTALVSAARRLPNMCADRVLDMGAENRVIFERPFTEPGFKLRKFEDIAKILSGARLNNLGLLTGERTYFLTGALAELEQALVQWTVDRVAGAGFSLVSVPDLLHPAVISACGMAAEGERTQVYHLDPVYGRVALSGTAEMALGGYLAGKSMPESSLPGRLCAVSRCYRAETGRQGEERGLYRVHQFTKVEMFCVTRGRAEESAAALSLVHGLERELFTALGLAFRVLDMCAEELGDPASEKYDIEAWLPGRGMWGEVSSCSNCSDYQARRLHITEAATGRHCHTVNGTACAVPRMLIAICEQNQTENGSVLIPEPLRPYMRGRELMEPKKRKERMNFVYINSAKYFEKNKKIC